MKRSLTVRFASLFLLICLLSLPSCNSGGSGSDGEMVTFTDALGREIVVPKEPKRVAALIGSFADVWILAGGELCAASEDAEEDFGIDMDNMVNIGGAHSPNLEALLAAAPDLVLASASTASNVEMEAVLTDAGICVVYFDVDNFYDYLEMLDICTDITGRKDLYDKNGVAVRTQIEEKKTDFEGFAIPDEQKKVLLLRISSTSVKAKNSNGTILGEMLKDIGCINIADSDATILENLSIESVMRNEPYRIFIVSMGIDTDRAKAIFTKMTEDNPAWGQLESVSSGRVHFMEKKLFNIKPNARWGEAYHVLCKAFGQ